MSSQEQISTVTEIAVGCISPFAEDSTVCPRVELGRSIDQKFVPCSIDVTLGGFVCRASGDFPTPCDVLTTDEYAVYINTIRKDNS